MVEDMNVGIELAPKMAVAMGSLPRPGVPEVVEDFEGAWDNGHVMLFMARRSLLENSLTDEARRTVLREATDRYLNELLDDEERMLLLDRIRRLRRQLRLA